MPGCRRAWTVVELLVVIAITGLLIAVAAPALRGARERTMKAMSRAHLRTHAQVFAAYASDHAGSLPFLAAPTTAGTRHEAGGYSTDMLVFTQYATWPIAMAGDYYGGDVESASFHPPYSQKSGPITEYWYSQSFVADSRFWNPSHRAYELAQLRATGIHEVTFPSSKGLLIEREQAFDRWESGAAGDGESVHVALVDGSGRGVQAADLTRPYPGGCRGYLLGPIIGLPVMHTIDGVRGRDLSP